MNLFKALKTLLLLIVVLVAVYLLLGRIVLMGIALLLSIMLIAATQLVVTFTEKRIIEQTKRPIRIIIGVVLFASSFYLATLVFYGDFQLNEVHIKDEAELIEFSNSPKQYATLHTDQFHDVGFSIISTSSQSVGIFFGGGYIEMPTGQEIKEAEYSVNIVQFGSKLALYMVRDNESAPETENGLQVEKAEDSLQEYCDKTLVKDLASAWDMDEEYLRGILLPVTLQSVGATDKRAELVNTGLVCGALVLICAFLSFVVPKTTFLKKHSKFGKIISKREEFNVIEKKINKQVKTPVFSDDNITITQDYIIGQSRKSKSGFWYIDELVGVEIKEDVVYAEDDIRYKASLFMSDDEVHFKTFDKDAVEDIILRINNRGAMVK